MIFRRIGHISISFLIFLLLVGSAFLAMPQVQEDPSDILKEADRLAWLKNWSRAEPVFARAEQLVPRPGDERNALYAKVGKLRGQLPRLPIQQTSNQLAELLDNPFVRTDAQLRLRVLPIHLTQLANVKTARGRYSEAAALCQEAIDVLNAQLIHASSPANKASRIGMMDAIYVGYFGLAATKLNDLNRAFTVVEQARGRSIADLIAVRDNIPPNGPHR